MKKVFWIFMVIVVIGCAKVNLQTSQPLKVDINMRVDVYQHVAADVASVQDQIYGSTEKQMNAIFFIDDAYAQAQSPEVAAAIERRKDRRSVIDEYASRGYIGENRGALIEVIGKDIPSDLLGNVKSAVSQENSDRKIIYAAIAEKNGAAISETAKVFFDDDYKRAPAGYWFEDSNGAWQQK
jgi:uncharacterized protein YdbL (DUF1318 family)